MTECVALLVIHPRRPESVTVPAPGGGLPARISVKAHDEWYLKQVRRFKRQIFLTHPDRTGRVTEFLNVSRKFRTFQKREAAVYAWFGLAPPKWK